MAEEEESNGHRLGILLLSGLLIVIFIVLDARAEVTCTRDYGGRIVIGECWIFNDGQYYTLDDVVSLSQADGKYVVDAHGIDGSKTYIEPIIVSKTGQEYTLSSLSQSKKLGYRFITSGKKFSLELDYVNVSSIVTNNIDRLTFKISGELPKEIKIDWSDLMRSNFSINVGTTETKVYNITGIGKKLLDPELIIQGGGACLGDTWINEYSTYANTNYGTADNIQIAPRNNIEYWIYVKFNLTSPGIIPEGATITNATLSLRQWWENMEAGESQDAKCYWLNESRNGTYPSSLFSETGITWNTRNNYAKAYANNLLHTQAIDDAFANSILYWYYWNVTNGVRGDYQNNTNISGYLLIDVEETVDDDAAVFRSREYSNSSLGPRLIIYYEEGGATTTTTSTTTTSTTTTTTTLLPQVALWQPNNGTSIFPGIEDFSANITNATNPLSWTMLWSNFTGSWSITNYSKVHVNGSITFSYGMVFGNYIWTLAVNDSANNWVWASENRTITVTTSTTTTTTTTTIPPQIFHELPPNATEIVTGTSQEFQFGIQNGSNQTSILFLEGNASGAYGPMNFTLAPVNGTGNISFFFDTFGLIVYRGGVNDTEGRTAYTENVTLIVVTTTIPAPTTTTSTSTTSTTSTSTTTTIYITTTTLGTTYFQPVIVQTLNGTNTWNVSVCSTNSVCADTFEYVYQATRVNATEDVLYLENYSSAFNRPYYFSVYDDGGRTLYEKIKGRLFGDRWEGNLTVDGDLNVTGNIYVAGCIVYNGGTLGSCV